MFEFPLWLPLLFFLIALLYSMVGFGGGSSYLAILILAGLTYETIPPLALLCNLIVVTGGFIHFYRAGYFNLNRVLPFVIASIPMAYWGGKILISDDVFSLLLGFSLLAVAVRLFLPDISKTEVRQVSGKQEWLVGLPVGALLGFLAGVVGIGGGIFLSPILLLMRWVNVKQAAAAACFFILVNSIAGLAGQATKGVFHLEMIVPLGLAVLIGGQIGSRLGSFHLPKKNLARILAVLVLYVSVRLISTAI